MRPINCATFVLTASLLAACAPVDSTPMPLTENQSATLSKQLAGKADGKTIAAIVKDLLNQVP